MVERVPCTTEGCEGEGVVHWSQYSYHYACFICGAQWLGPMDKIRDAYPHGSQG